MKTRKNTLFIYLFITMPFLFIHVVVLLIFMYNECIYVCLLTVYGEACLPIASVKNF